MVSIQVPTSANKVISKRAARRLRGIARRDQAAARRRDRAERKAKRSARRVVRGSRAVYLFVAADAGFIRITKIAAREIINALGTKLIVSTTGHGDCCGLEVSPF